MVGTPLAMGRFSRAVGSGRRSRLRADRAVRHTPLGTICLLYLVGMLGIGVCGRWVGAGDPLALDPLAVLAPPSSTYPMGTDDLGRSVLARTVHGLRTSYVLATAAALVAAALGTVVGLVAGYVRGLPDEVAMRLTDVLFAFPTLLLGILVAAVLGPGNTGILITIAIATLPAFSRVARGPTLSMRAKEYVVAARVNGSSEARILLRHVLPNISSPLLVQLTFTLSVALIVEDSLSFLGIGVQPPTASLGSLVRDGKIYMEIAPWTAIFPGAILALTILAINLLGDELQALSDPRLRRR